MKRTVVAIILMLALASSSQAVVISDFEGDLSGWFTDTWTTGTLSLSSTGASTGAQAMQVDTPGGWQQACKKDVRVYRDVLGVPGAVVSADVTSFRADMISAWTEIEVVINAQNHDNNGADPQNNIGWNQLGLMAMDLTGVPQTINWSVPAELSAKIAASDDNIQWFEFVLVCNTDSSDPASVGKFYIDNIQVVPEPATMLMLGLGGLFLRRKK